MTVAEGQKIDELKAQIANSLEAAIAKIRQDWPPFPEIKRLETAASSLQQAQTSLDDWRRMRLAEAAQWIRQGTPGRALEVIELLLEGYEQ